MTAQLRVFESTYRFMPFVMTTLQAEIIGYLDSLPNGASQQDISDVYLKHHAGSEEMVYEALSTLNLNGYIGQDWVNNVGFVYGLTDMGIVAAIDLKRWFGGVRHCPACVRLPCVCSISIGCLDGGPELDHSTGCHGSHD